MASPGDKRGALRIGVDWLGARGALLSLIAVKIAVGALADASLPDPVWNAGIYDDGDFDDVVNQIASIAGALDWWTPPPRPHGSGETIVLLGSSGAARTTRALHRDRAPPISRSSCSSP